MPTMSRRRFLQGVSTATAATAALSLLPPGMARASSQVTAAANAQTLVTGWQYLRIPLAGPWEVWMNPPLAPWADISLPHCFNSYDGCDPDTPAYRGKGWYRRLLDTANPYPGGRTLLHFEGAGQSCEVYVDGSFVARHKGGYDEFVIDITDFVAKPETKVETQLSVLCDNSSDLERLPSDLSDFTLYGGLYRNVHLVYVPAVSLEMVHARVNAEAGKPAQIAVEARLYNPGKLTGVAQIAISVLDPSGTEIHTTHQQQPLWDGNAELATFSIDSPAFWSPRTPHLYQCRVTIGAPDGESVHVERFGIRFFEFQEHGPFLLNGERVLIQGTHRHQDHAGYAAAMPAELIRQEMQLIKDMGANFIRLAHYQQPRLVLELCDELGILVWEELPWCRAGVGDEAFRQQGREKLTAMIEQHFNHPSIILWGLGNEDDWIGEYPAIDQRAIRGYMQDLNTLAHQLDRSRLTSFRRCDFARDVPDVYSPSIWAGWYGGKFIDYESALEQQRAKSPRLLHVEWGADSHAQRHAEDPYKALSAVKDGDTAERGMAYLLQGGTARASSDGDWSETYACDLFDWHLKVQQSLPWLSGAVQWCFKDFTSPLRPENPIPRVNQAGLIERDMTKKEGYYVFQSYWAEKPMVHIYGHSWPVRWGAPGQPRRVRVYSSCPSVELFLNGVSVGARKRDIQNFPAAGLRWDIPFRAGNNLLRAIASTADGATVSDEISFAYQTQIWGAPAKLQIGAVEREANKVTVEATLLDAEGVICLDARNQVRFTLAGAGALLDNQGASTGSRVIQLYNGRASISILRGAGAACVGVGSEGIAPGFCSI